MRDCTSARRATPPRRYPAITGMEQRQYARQFCEPHQRPGPPDFTRNREDCISTAKLGALGKQESQLKKQFVARHSQQRSNAGVLQWRNAEAAAFQDWCKPARDADAKTTFGVKEEPALRMPSFSIRIFAC